MKLARVIEFYRKSSTPQEFRPTNEFRTQILPDGIRISIREHPTPTWLVWGFALLTFILGIPGVAILLLPDKSAPLIFLACGFCCGFFCLLYIQLESRLNWKQFEILRGRFRFRNGPLPGFRRKKHQLSLKQIVRFGSRQARYARNDNLYGDSNVVRRECFVVLVNGEKVVVCEIVSRKYTATLLYELNLELHKRKSS